MRSRHGGSGGAAAESWTPHGVLPRRAGAATAGSPRADRSSSVRPATSRRGARSVSSSASVASTWLTSARLVTRSSCQRCHVSYREPDHGDRGRGTGSGVLVDVMDLPAKAEHRPAGERRAVAPARWRPSLAVFGAGGVPRDEVRRRRLGPRVVHPVGAGNVRAVSPRAVQPAGGNHGPAGCRRSRGAGAEPPRRPG